MSNTTILPCPIQFVLAGEDNHECVWERSELLDEYRRGGNGWKGDARLLATYKALGLYTEQEQRDYELMRVMPKVRSALPADSAAYHWARAFQGYAADEEPYVRALASGLATRMDSAVNQGGDA